MAERARTDQARGEQVAAQVARALQASRTLQDGTTRTVLRLTPEHLGAVTLTVDVRGGAVRLSVSGSREAVAALDEGLEALRSDLAGSGLQLGDVTLREDGAPRDPAWTGTGASAGGTGSEPGESGGRHGTTAPPAAPAAARRAPLAGDGGAGTATAPGGPVTAGRFDVRV